MSVMMMFGLMPFGIDTAAYQKLRRQSDFRWAEQDRIGTRSAVQWIGPGSDRIDLSGVLYPHYKGSMAGLDWLAVQNALGLPLPLVDGLGYWYGFWCLESLQTDRSEFAASGSPMKVQFKAKLKRYGWSLF